MPLFSRKRLLEIGIPADYLKLKLGDYRGPFQNGNFVEAYCRNVSQNSRGQGIYFFGDRETGKTLLGVVCMKAYLNSGFSALRVLCDDLITCYAGSLTDRSLVEPLQTTHFLFIDDVGRERVTKISGKGLSSIMSYRAEHGLPTVLGSTVSVDNLDDLYSREQISRLIERKYSIVHLTRVEKMKAVFRSDRERMVR